MWLKQEQFALIVIPLSHSSAYTITIVRYIFKPQLFFSHAVHLHTKLTELFLNSPLPALSYLLYRNVSSLMYVLEGECLPSRSLFKCKQVVYAILVCVFRLRLSL